MWMQSECGEEIGFSAHNGRELKIRITCIGKFVVSSRLFGDKLIIALRA
jgi:hypothetical protein